MCFLAQKALKAHFMSTFLWLSNVSLQPPRSVFLNHYVRLVLLHICPSNPTICLDSSCLILSLTLTLSVAHGYWLQALTNKETTLICKDCNCPVHLCTHCIPNRFSCPHEPSEPCCTLPTTSHKAAPHQSPLARLYPLHHSSMHIWHFHCTTDHPQLKVPLLPHI